MSFLKEHGRDFHTSVLVTKKAGTFLCTATGAVELKGQLKCWFLLTFGKVTSPGFSS